MRQSRRLSVQHKQCHHQAWQQTGGACLEIVCRFRILDRLHTSQAPISKYLRHD